MASAHPQIPLVPDLLTLIITTSVTPSIPHTDLLSAILDGFRTHSPQLLDCRVVVVFDNYDQVTSQARLKKGQVTQQQADDWSQYKVNAKKLIFQHFQESAEVAALITEEGEAEYGGPHIASNFVAFTATRTPDRHVTFIEPVRRLGFGLAVRSALRMVETPYVWVQQHDWNLAADIPLANLLQVMRQHEANIEVPIKYVCFPATRMLCYAASADVKHFPVLEELTTKLKRDFAPPQQPEEKIPLTPLFLWHDKPHVALTEHYLARVFPSRLAMLRGDFIEDKIGQRARAQMKERLWSKWATWLYYPDEGRQLCVRHLQGRIWRGVVAHSEQVSKYRERNLKEMQELESLQTETTDANTTAESHALSSLF